jgi:hypothetical protein
VSPPCGEEAPEPGTNSLLFLDMDSNKKKYKGLKEK